LTGPRGWFRARHRMPREVQVPVKEVAMGEWEHKEWRWGGKGGVSLYAQSWTPPEPRAAMIVVHGLGEHLGRYGNVVSYFCPKGIAVLGYDHRGFGKSEGTRAYVDAFDDFLDDLDAFATDVRGRLGGEPLVVVGHSMGGLIVLRWAAARAPSVAAVVSSGAALEVVKPVPAAKRLVARVLLKLAPKLSIPNELDPRGLTHDTAVVKAYVEDPLVFRNITVRLGSEIMRCMEETLGFAARVKAPLLLLHGEKDPLVAVSGSRKFYESTGAPHKQLHVYPGFYHEIFNEIGKEKVFQDIEVWLTQVL
jgi:acylglycerol lipase